MSSFPTTPHINVLDDIGFGRTVLKALPLRKGTLKERTNETYFSDCFGLLWHWCYA